ncbi:ImmA/IrrE family metallo-endopeptidase [Fibrobacter sp.]|uniref:ImmA/IrrE family metallo-endopeptidase n=1 Tax=Fibrobacter sp. TaxID=35828 RepID=UPI00389067A6
MYPKGYTTESSSDPNERWKTWHIWAILYSQYFDLIDENGEVVDSNIEFTLPSGARMPNNDLIEDAKSIWKAWKNYYTNASLKVAFRISLAEAQDPFAASVWLRRGEILADAIKMEKQNDKKQRVIIKKALPQFIELAKAYGAQRTMGKPGEIDEGMLKLQELGSSLGMKILYVQNFKSARIHGMARWYRDIPVIQLHDRFKNRKAFWYTFFHELSHIILHGKKDIFIKNMYHGNKNPVKEAEADAFAQKCMADAGLDYVEK